MSNIISDSSSVNNYLLTKQKADQAAENKILEGLHERRQRELEMQMTPEEQKLRLQDMQLAAAVGNELVRHYPGHGWQVESDIANGVVKIFNCHMSGLTGYLLHTSKIDFSSFSHTIMMVGGEMLDRFGLSRGKFNEEEVLNVQRDHTGSAKVDLS